MVDQVAFVHCIMLAVILPLSLSSPSSSVLCLNKNAVKSDGDDGEDGDEFDGGS